MSRGVALAPADKASEVGKYREWKRGQETLSVGRQKTVRENIWRHLNLYSHNEVYSTHAHTNIYYIYIYTHRTGATNNKTLSNVLAICYYLVARRNALTRKKTMYIKRSGGKWGRDCSSEFIYSTGSSHGTRSEWITAPQQINNLSWISPHLYLNNK